MPNIFRASVAAIALIAIPAAPAHAQLGGLLPGLGEIVQDVGQTVESTLPVSGGAVTGVTGTVGGIVNDTQGTLTSTVDQVLGDVLSGTGTGSLDGLVNSLLPTDTLDQLLLSLGLAPVGADGAPAGGGVGGTTAIGPDGNPVVDAAAPNAKVRVLSRLTQIRKTGSLRLEVSTDEAGVVAMSGAIRPGLAVKSKKKSKRARAAAVKHSRKLIKFPAAILAFRKAGKLQVTVKLGRTARSTLGRSRDARMSIATLAADLARNQVVSQAKHKIKR